MRLKAKIVFKVSWVNFFSGHPVHTYNYIDFSGIKTKLMPSACPDTEYAIHSVTVYMLHICQNFQMAITQALYKFLFLTSVTRWNLFHYAYTNIKAIRKGWIQQICKGEGYHHIKGHKPKHRPINQRGISNSVYNVPEY